MTDFEENEKELWKRTGIGCLILIIAGATTFIIWAVSKFIN
jgi:hypothetical protein